MHHRKNERFGFCADDDDVFVFRPMGTLPEPEHF
jgi:hypothetical protein